ncbi:MAG TPA: 5-oxoprolinase subunit PxpA [Candidatus Obscuribacterales bacterium]
MRRSRQRPRGNRESQQASSGFVTQQSPTAKLFLKHGIDINTNLGEGFGHYRIEGESDVLPYVTSANIACGAHAGDPVLMEAALEEVRYYGLSLGAHIGYPDLAGFGRREIHLSTTELRASVLYQLGALAGLARTFGFELTQVRPHGFLYRQISHDVRIATVVAKAIAEFDRWLVLIGPAGGNLLAAGERAGIRVAGEAWIDRAYDGNGNLVPHSHSRAIMKSYNEIISQARSLIETSEVPTVDGSRVKMDFQTIHLHAGLPHARQIAEEIRSMIPSACSLTSEPFTIDEDRDAVLAYTV